TTDERAGWLRADGARRSRIGARRQVPLIPGDPEHTVASRALEVGGMTLDRRPRVAHGAHDVSVAPGARDVAGVARTRHDGPEKRAPEHRFEQATRHGHGLGRHLQDRLGSGHLDDTVPPAPSQPAVYVHAKTGPGDRQFLIGARQTEFEIVDFTPPSTFGWVERGQRKGWKTFFRLDASAGSTAVTIRDVWMPQSFSAWVRGRFLEKRKVQNQLKTMLENLGKLVGS